MPLIPVSLGGSDHHGFGAEISRDRLTPNTASMLRIVDGDRAIVRQKSLTTSRMVRSLSCEMDTGHRTTNKMRIAGTGS